MTRGGETIRMAAGGLALVIIAMALGALAWRPELRVTADATRTRAYSLSPQTRGLLAELEGDWRIAVILASGRVEPELRRQVDEVLRRFAAAAPSLDVISVDPADPASLAAYERLLGRLRSMEQATIDRYERTLDAGEADFEELRLFATRIASSLEVAAGRFPADDPRRRRLEQRTAPIAILAREGQLLADAVRDARTPSDDVPIPQYDDARSILREALSQWSDQLLALATLLDEWIRAPGLEPDLRNFARGTAPEARTLASRLVATSETLLALPDLQLARVGRQLAGGEAALVLGPSRAAVVPSAELFPTVQGSPGLRLDRRFRGEQVISAAIRSMQVPVMPMVVFIHGQPGSIVRPSADGTDVAGVQQALVASRYVVREWAVERDERPQPEIGQPVVWIPLSPSRQTSPTPDATERALLDATRTLIEEGESVLLSVYPSVRPRYGINDPWAEIAGSIGVSADSGRVLVQATPLAAEQFSVDAGVAIDAFEPDSALGRALEGQRLALPLSVALTVTAEPDAATERTVIAAAEPSPRRWLESEWTTGQLPATPAPGGALTTRAPLLVAVERSHPFGASAGVPDLRGRQRLLVVGSGGWLRTQTADAVADTGDGRTALINPGNHELMLAGAAWLAGQDDLVAASSAGRQVARLSGITPAVRTRWAVGTVVVAPLLIIALGLGGWAVRRRGT